MGETEPTLDELTTELETVVNKWRQLGVKFGFSDGQLNAIEMDRPHGGTTQWMCSMLDKRLKDLPAITWNDIVMALGRIGCGKLAENIQRKYCTSGIMSRTPQEDLVVRRLLERNESVLKRKFSSLLCHSIAEIEKKKSINFKKFVSYVKSYFMLNDPANLDKSDFHTVFDTISGEKHWHYLKYDPLLEILEEFVDEETEEQREEYQRAVTVYHTITKLPHWINRNEVCKETSSPSLSPNCDKLSIKLDSCNIDEKTLEFVRNLWKSISKNFRLPKLNAVLHNVEHGCVCITWEIKSHTKTRELIIENLPSSKQFLEESNIVRIIFNDECIYMYPEDLPDGDSDESLRATEIRQLKESTAANYSFGLQTSFPKDESLRAAEMRQLKQSAADKSLKAAEIRQLMQSAAGKSLPHAHAGKSLPRGSATSWSKGGMAQGLTNRDEVTVNMVNVVEHLTGKRVTRKEAVKFFSEVDRDGEGQVDIANLLMVLKEGGVNPMQALVPCHALPGPLEVYLPSKEGYGEAGRKLIQFLQARRVESSCLVVNCMDQVLDHQRMREKLVLEMYKMLQLRADDGELLQIDVRARQSDGCNTMLASTAQETISIAPHQRDAIISQSRPSLAALRPLVLSPTSGTRPKFLSSFVIQEMEKVLKSLSLPGETFESVSAESLEVLLAFSIAYGNVNSILDCLHILLDNQSVELSVCSLLVRMEVVKKTKHYNNAEQVNLKMVSCSGGYKDDSHRPDNIIYNDISNNSATSYVSATGHSAVSVVLREEDGRILTPTRLVVEVPSADNAATSCLLFVVDKEPEEAWLEGLSRYKDWGNEEYHKWLGETEGKDGSGLIARLEFNKDNCQVDVAPDVMRSGRSLVLRMYAGGEGVESVALQAVNVFGHCSTEEEWQTMAFLQSLDAMAPLPTEEVDVVGGVVLCRVLAFLSALLQDLSKQMDRCRLASPDPTLITEAHLSVDGLSLEKIWNIYIPLTLTSDGQTNYASLLALWLLRSALPFIKLDKRPAQELATDGPRSDGDHLTVPSAILSQLCALLDAEEGQGVGSTRQRLAQEIVVVGVAVFFPDATMRKEYLLSMIGSVLSEKQPRSCWVKFEALCRYYSKTDVNSLLGLPTRSKETQDEEVEMYGPLELLLTVATNESLMSLSSGKACPDYLLRLLCALQASLFFWCRNNMTDTTTQRVLLDYVGRVVMISIRILREVSTMKTNSEEKLKSLENSLLTGTLAEMLVFLTTIADSLMPKLITRLMDSLYPLVPGLHNATSSIEGVFLRLKVFGRSLPSLHWLFDLQLSTAYLVGLLTSTALSTKTLCVQMPERLSEEKQEEALLMRSDLWKNLFRGGYITGKNTRSLSGTYSTSPIDAELNIMLADMAYSPEDKSKQLLDSLREKVKAPYYGGELVDQAVTSVFAALIWHCQDLREELVPQLVQQSAFSDFLRPSQLLQDAFSTAEALRRDLVKSRQKLIEAKEKEEDEEKRSKVNEDAPLLACQEKAVFLLRFAGLSRTSQSEGEDEPDETNGDPAPHPGRLCNAINTVERLKEQLALRGQSNSRKRPLSFDLVLSFVKTDAISVEKVHRLLKERETLACVVAKAYTFASEYLITFSIDYMFELPGLVFLQQLIAKQRHFPIHYAAKLDGCGLELENQVRKSYRLLLRQLLDGLSAFSRPPSVEYSRARLLVSIISCHLLTCQWKDYDHQLVAELQLSDFLVQCAIESTQIEEKDRVEQFEGERAMLARYSLHMALLEKVKELGSAHLEALEELVLYRDNKWEAELFLVAKARSSEMVDVQCDGCENVVRSGTVYHNMELLSTCFDLCPSCFKNGSGNRPDDHTSDQLYHALGRFVCDGCKLCIMSHRFHSNTRHDCDLCLGCLRKEEANGSTDTWSVFLLTEVASEGSANRYMTSDPEYSTPLLYQGGSLIHVGPALDLMVYQQQHCWLQITALCLRMAHCLNSKESLPHEQEYKVQACRNLMHFLGQFAYLLRTAVQAKWVGQNRKAREEERERQKKKEEEEEAGKESEGGGDTAAAAKSAGWEEGVGVGGEGGGGEEGGGEGGGGEEGGAPSGADKTETTPTATEDTPTTSEPELPEAKATPEDEDLITVASRLRWQGNTDATSMEKTFASLNISSTLYTLAAVLPEDFSLSAWVEVGWMAEECLTSELLPALLEVAACTPIPPSSRQLAYLVTAQYMTRANPQVADRSIQIARGCSQDQPRSEDRTSKHGLMTAEYFFSVGVGFLCKSDFNGAATITECLLLLSRSLPWRAAVSLVILSPLTTRPEDMDMFSIFGLMVLAGFPKLHRVGSLVRVHCSEAGQQQQPLSVLTSVEGESGTVVSVKCREPSSVKLSRCEVEDTLRGCIAFSQLLSLLPLLHRSLQLAKLEGSRQVEATWILALALKALLTLLEGSESEEAVKAVLKEGLLPGITVLASKGTRLSQKWLASDLEVVAIRGYQPAVPGQEAASRSDINQFVMSSEQYLMQSHLPLRSACREPQEHSVQHEVQDIQESLEDVGVTHLVPIPLSPSTLEAEPEVDLLMQQKSSGLMQEGNSSSKMASEEKEEVTREDSFQLLQEGLKGGVASREQLLKMHQAIVVLYARHVLAALLTCWPHPPHPHISTSVLGNIDVMQLFCLLDLLMKPLKHKACSDLLRSLVQCSEPTELVSLALTAVQCMRKVSVGVERRQFSHPADKPLEKKGQVVIANASSITVIFHQTKGKVELSSREDFSDHHKTVSHSESNTQREHTHLIPGNTVHYRVALDAAKEANHPLCTISITGTQMGRFSTGLNILKQLLGEEGAGEGGERGEEGRQGIASCLPPSQLWSNLIAVACQHTSCERLKVIHLLIRLLGVMKESAVQERPDLSALKPLWHLYSTLTNDYEAKNQMLAPEIVRALTELFLAVENQAEEWGVSQHMVIEMLTQEEDKANKDIDGSSSEDDSSP